MRCRRGSPVDRAAGAGPDVAGDRPPLPGPELEIARGKVQTADTGPVGVGRDQDGIPALDGGRGRSAAAAGRDPRPDLERSRAVLPGADCSLGRDALRGSDTGQAGARRSDDQIHGRRGRALAEAERRRGQDMGAAGGFL